LTPIKPDACPAKGGSVGLIAMGSRVFRRLVARFAMVALVFGQFALAAYACQIERPMIAVGGPHASVATDSAPVPCAGMDALTQVQGADACTLHCNDGAMPPASPDLPQIALAALVAPAIARTQLAMADEVSRTPYAALPGAPPLTLAFCRLLI
jgi:hypothetical protein